MHDDRQMGRSRLSWTLWILGGAALATLVAAACGSANEQQQGDDVISARQALHDTLEAVDDVPPDYVVVPGGHLLHKDCVHAVPDGADVDDRGNVKLHGVLIAHHSGCSHKAYRHRDLREMAGAHPPSVGSGWVENSISSGPTQATFTAMFYSYWQVPAAPTTNNNQLVYLFPSFTSSTWIVQPVLQWGGSTAGGGAFWSMAGWIVSPFGPSGTLADGPVAYHSTLVQVNAGDQMEGAMQMIYNNATSQQWQVIWVDHTLNGGQFINLTTNDNRPMTQAEPGVLEAYGIGSCSDFPSTGFTQFSGPYIYQGNDYNGQNLIIPSFTAQPYTTNGWTGPVCGFGVNVFADGRTQLYY